MIKLICNICGKEYEVPPCRKDISKYCSRKCFGESKRGKNHFNYGKHLSEETKRKIGAARKGHAPWNKGKHLTDEDKKKKSEAIKRWAKTPKGRAHFKKMNKLSHMPEAEEKRSKSISKWNIEEYKRDPQRGKRLTRKAHKKIRQMFKEGTHPFQNPETRKKTMRALYKKNYGGTWIEKKIGWLLAQMGIKTIPQKPIPYGVDSWGRPKYLFPDFVLPSHNLIIECDGEYWHQDERREKQRDRVFAEQGYKTLHLSGTEIRQNLEGCRNQIESLI